MGIITEETSPRSWFAGNACYVFNRNKFVNNVNSMKQAFRQSYQNVAIAYSYKTNYLAEICTLAHNTGCLAEVVSPEEFWYAGKFERLSKIVYNGVIPDEVNKLDVLVNNGIVNIDCQEELNRMISVAKTFGYSAKSGRKMKIGIRVTCDVGNDIRSRFGVELGGSEFKYMLMMIENSGVFELAGLHCHIGCCRDPKLWNRKAEIVIAAAKDLKLEYIDLGGGMFGTMERELADQFDGYPGSFEAYGKPVGAMMKEVFPKEDVKLIVEPGTALVGNTMNAVSKVVSIKHTLGETYITTNVNSNSLGVICDMKNLPIEVVHMPNVVAREHVENATIAGNTCLEFDYLRKGFSGEIGVGDKIVFKNVGAYSISASRQFIVPRMMVIDESSMDVLRRREDEVDMFSKYLI